MHACTFNKYTQLTHIYHVKNKLFWMRLIVAKHKKNTLKKCPRLTLKCLLNTETVSLAKQELLSFDINSEINPSDPTYFIFLILLKYNMTLMHSGIFTALYFLDLSETKLHCKEMYSHTYI